VTGTFPLEAQSEGANRRQPDLAGQTRVPLVLGGPVTQIAQHEVDALVLDQRHDVEAISGVEPALAYVGVTGI
jgi:hypothetical protein